MKAILTYNEKYQIKYIYDNEFEAEYFTTYLTTFKKRNLIKAYYTEINSKRTNKETIRIIEKTDIIESIIIPFISLLISINNIPVIINETEFTSFNITKIETELYNLNKTKLKILKL